MRNIRIIICVALVTLLLCGCDKGASLNQTDPDQTRSQETEAISADSSEANGTPMTVTHKTGSSATLYYYVTNLQGDIIAIVDASGNVVADYAYDAWGNPIEDPDAPNTTIATLNPLRYRGYVWDAETRLYYLQSRYYDPQIGRFINADAFVSTGQGIFGNNMFAYCLDNPVVCADYKGVDAVILLDTNSVGHIGIMAQDSEGVWWHFYWGANRSDFGWTIWGINLVVTTWCVEYTGALTLEGINNSGQFSGDYEYFAYIPGDFSSCIEEMKNPTGKYNLYTNNCSQKSLSILAAANTSYQGALSEASKHVSPMTAYFYVETRIALEMGKEEGILKRLIPKKPIRIPIIGGGIYARNI